MPHQRARWLAMTRLMKQNDKYEFEGVICRRECIYAFQNPIICTMPVFLRVCGADISAPYNCDANRTVPETIQILIYRSVRLPHPKPSPGERVPSAHTGRVWNGVHWQSGKSLQQCGNCKITARIPHPTSLRSATFSPGEGICGASDKQYDKLEMAVRETPHCRFVTIHCRTGSRRASGRSPFVPSGFRGCPAPPPCPCPAPGYYPQNGWWTDEKTPAPFVRCRREGIYAFRNPLACTIPIFAQLRSGYIRSLRSFYESCCRYRRAEKLLCLGRGVLHLTAISWLLGQSAAYACPYLFISEPTVPSLPNFSLA